MTETVNYRIELTNYEKAVEVALQLQEELSQLEAQLEHKEERWMYLTELKEKIDAQAK